MSSVSPNGDAGSPRLGGAANSYGARSVVVALREMAKDLAGVPGRKSLIMLTSGFRLSDEIRSEVTAAIDMCNRSNVAVYPIDVRGLTTMPSAMPSGGRPRGELRFPSWSPMGGPAIMLSSFAGQTRAGGTGGAPPGGGGPPAGGGGGTGRTGGTGGAPGGGGPVRTGGGPSNPTSGHPTSGNGGGNNNNNTLN